MSNECDECGSDRVTSLKRRFGGYRCNACGHVEKPTGGLDKLSGVKVDVSRN